jgi:hypothetical protein
MLYYAFKSGPFTVGTERTWYIGEKIPPHSFEDNPIVFVQADGNELEYVLANIQGLPNIPEKRVMVWRAPWAQFIVDNALPVKEEL